MKSGTDSAIAFGRVLQAARKHLHRNQADVAAAFTPPLSIAAVSMAESGGRPPKSEAVVRSYATALDLDDDDLVELWWALQGMVALEDSGQERTVQRWWRQLPTYEVSLDIAHWEAKADRIKTPNELVYAPSGSLFALANAVKAILERLLGDAWDVRLQPALGLSEPVEGYRATVGIELRTNSDGPGRLVASFPCPEPATRPVVAEPASKPKVESLPSDITWIVSALESMPIRERAAVAGFIHALQRGARLFSDDVSSAMQDDETHGRPRSAALRKQPS